ncbi:MAG: TetR/AcrR family transcriptional regulator [Actinobacteria bacterium]|nr:TetR/AcrR family transcriptional regulator [Actinomycetota bacterium]
MIAVKMGATPEWSELEVLSRLKDSALLEERRRQLVQAATEVFFELGFDRASVNDIAERCGWSVGGLYRYVRRKDDILFLVCTEIFRQIGPDALGTSASLDPSEQLRAAMTAYCQSISLHSRQVLLMYREFGRLPASARRYFMHLESELHNVFQQIVESGVAQGVFACDDPKLFAIDCVTRAQVLALKDWALQPRPIRQTIDALVSWTLASLIPQSPC